MFEINFDKKALKQIRKLSKDKMTRELIKSKLDFLEIKGPNCGKLLDSKLNLFELKSKLPSLRIYFYVRDYEITIIETHIKKSSAVQKKLIKKIKNLIPFSNTFSLFQILLLFFEENLMLVRGRFFL